MYSIEQCQRDVEHILCRPLNRIEYDAIDEWFQKYDSIHIHTCVELCKGTPHIRTAKYIDTIIFRQLVYYRIFIAIQEKDMPKQKKELSIEELDWLNQPPTAAKPQQEEIDEKALQEFSELLGG